MTNATDALRARLAEVLALRREAENEPLGSLGRMQAQGNFKDSAVMFFHDFGDETLAALATPAGSAEGVANLAVKVAGEAQRWHERAIAAESEAARLRENARVLAAFARTAPGRLPVAVQDAVAAMGSANGQG